MRIIRKINNNFALAVDASGEVIVVYGKGIGFHKTPYELTQLDRIDRTYYNIDQKYIGLINEIPELIFRISTVAVDLAKEKLECDLNPNLVFTLADHINFSVERVNKHIVIQYPFIYDIENLYVEELAIAKKIAALIQREFNIKLPRGEPSAIALHLVNAEMNGANENNHGDMDHILADITDICDGLIGRKASRESFNYSRFATHIQYLVQRGKTKIKIHSENQKLFHSVKEQYPDTYLCVMKIAGYFEENFSWELSEEEILYLMLHVNRMCEREEYM